MSAVQGKRCQLCGPVSGLPRVDAVGLFDAGTKVLFEAGAEYVFNPTSCVPPDAPRDRAMRSCIRWLITYADVLVRLPGWETSAGACLEVAVAKETGVAIIDIEEASK